jgi:hypothetical protein
MLSNSFQEERQSNYYSSKLTSEDDIHYYDAPYQKQKRWCTNTSVEEIFGECTTTWHQSKLDQEPWSIQKSSMEQQQIPIDNELNSTYSQNCNTGLEETSTTSMDDELPQHMQTQMSVVAPKLEEPTQEGNDIFEISGHCQSTDAHEDDSERCPSELSTKTATKKVTKKIQKPKSKIVTPENLAKAKKQAQKKTAIGSKIPPNSKKVEKKATAEHVKAICYKLFIKKRAQPSSQQSLLSTKTQK